MDYGGKMNTTKLQAVLVGAVAGAMPTLVSLVGIEPPALVADLNSEDTQKLVYGYSLRCVVLMFLGAFLVYVNSEIDKWKAFQIGILAPAIIVGIGVAGNLKETSSALRITQDVIQGIQNMQPTAPKTPAKLQPALFSSTAFAQTKGMHRDPPYLQHGATGRPLWLVVVGSHDSRGAAEAQGKQLKDSFGYDARTLPPSLTSRYYIVAVGSYLEYEEATRLRTQALDDGLPRSTFLMKLGG